MASVGCAMSDFVETDFTQATEATVAHSFSRVPFFNPDAPTSTAFLKLQKKIRKQVGEAIKDFNMIEDGDKVMVCVSGGKDSYTMLDIILYLKAIAPIHFDIVA